MGKVCELGQKWKQYGEKILKNSYTHWMAMNGSGKMCISHFKVSE